jgi:hypothetical protein
MTRPVDEYLGQLRASLRTRPAETSRILAAAMAASTARIALSMQTLRPILTP